MLTLFTDYSEPFAVRDLFSSSRALTFWICAAYFPRLAVRALYFTAPTGKRAYRRRDFAEPVQTQSKVWGPCLRLRPVNFESSCRDPPCLFLHGVLSPCTK